MVASSAAEATSFAGAHCITPVTHSYEDDAKGAQTCPRPRNITLALQNDQEGQSEQLSEAEIEGETQFELEGIVPLIRGQLPH